MDSESKRKINSFTKLIAWQASHKLVISTLKYCGQLQPHDPLRNQMERAALSITSNIAEGFGRQSIADKKHFYIVARGSAYELQNQLLVTRDMKKITEDDFGILAELSLHSIHLIHGLIRSIDRGKNANS